MNGSETPEEAALSDWPAAAKARVLRVRLEGDTAYVIVDVEPSHPVTVKVYRTEQGKWIYSSEGSGESF